MPEPKHPLLILPTATARAKGRRGGGGERIQFPARAAQGRRLDPAFNRLQGQLDERRAELLTALDGSPVEQVVVLEVAGSIANFQQAVAKAELHWLFEMDGEDARPDANFRVAKEAESLDPKKSIPIKLFLILTDQHAITLLLNLWKKWKKGGDAAFARGFKPWVHVFEHLKDVRLWGLQDRVGDDTRTYWRNRLEAGDQLIRTEIELWYSDSEVKNNEWETSLRSLLQSSNSAIVDQADVSAIRYRALLVDLSRQVVESLLAGETAPLGIAGQIMYYRPQVRGMVVSGGADSVAQDIERPVPSDAPVVAVLDGVPLQNHVLLGARILVDDPDDLQGKVEAKDRVHGTSMASVVLHGDLNGNSPTIASQVVVHPILVPDPHSHDVPKQELSPPDRLLADVIHVAIKRLVEGQGPNAPVAPSVRVVNLSIGDLRREFTRTMSPLARLLDWLSWKYRVLFVVPTGNYGIAEIELDVAREALEQLSADERAATILRAIEADTEFRRLLSPAESINSITVGGIYSDASTFVPPANRFTIFSEPWPAPEGRFGPGFLRGVKPDVVAPSGRRLFGPRLGNTRARAAVHPINVSTPPGIRAAVPGAPAGARNHSKYCCGTSNAAALVSHAAAHAHAGIVRLRQDEEIRSALAPRLDAVLLKALVVHTCMWPESQALEAALQTELIDANERKRRLARMFGYGQVDLERARGCTDERATLIAVGEIEPEKGLSYFVPLPHSLAGKREWRRLTITLAWLSPINPQHRDYRRGLVWFQTDHSPLKVSTVGADWQAARRGTVQHEVWSGGRATAYGKDAQLEIVVSCAADAGLLKEPLPYALCVSLEVHEGIEIPIYEEISARVRPPVRVAP